MLYGGDYENLRACETVQSGAREGIEHPIFDGNFLLSLILTFSLQITLRLER